MGAEAETESSSLDPSRSLRPQLWVVSSRARGTDHHQQLHHLPVPSRELETEVHSLEEKKWSQTQTYKGAELRLKKMSCELLECAKGNVTRRR